MENNKENKKYRDEIIIEGGTLWTEYWSCIYSFCNCTMYMSLSNFYYTLELMKATVNQFMDAEKLNEYLKDQERLFKFLGNDAVLNAIDKFEQSNNKLSDILVLNKRQNLKIRLFKDIPSLKGDDGTIARPIVDTIAFAALNKIKNNPIPVVTSNEAILDFVKQNNVRIEVINLAEGRENIV